jgi:hypothetical protein
MQSATSNRRLFHNSSTNLIITCFGSFISITSDLYRAREVIRQYEVPCPGREISI